MSQELQQEFLAAFDQYSDAIFRFCLVKTSNRERAEDLTQEAFMRYWQSLRDGREMTNTRSFLYTTARNLIIDWYRKRKSDSLDTKLESGLQLGDTSIASAETHAAYSEVIAALDQLDDGDAEVLTLRYVEGLEPRTIAELLDLSANTVSVRINRAMKRLHKLLDV